MSPGGRRSIGRWGLADEFAVLAGEYHDLARDLDLAYAIACTVEADHVLAQDLADTLGRVRSHADDLAHRLDRTIGRDLAPTSTLARALYIVIDRDHNLARDLACGRGHVRASDIARDLARDHDRAVELADLLTGQAHMLRADRTRSGHRRLADRVEVEVLSWLARPLPAAERARFVAEERGNLSECGCRWERVDRLVDLAIETPRLAWQLRRAGWRERV